MGIPTIHIPSRWIVIGLVGLSLDFIGAILLAASATERFKDRLKLSIETDFTNMAKASRDTLRSEGKITVNDPEFEYFNDAVSPYLDGEISSYEWIETEVALGDKVKLEFQSGESDELTQIQINNAIDRFERELYENLINRVNLFFGLILALGFLLQIVSYLARHFVS